MVELLFFSLIINNSCVQPYTPSLNKSDLISQLVVEGRVTDEKGPFRVRLTRSGPIYADQGVYTENPVVNAAVSITDNLGHTFTLLPVSDGWYETDDKDIEGIAGNSYTLYITDPDGTQYESDPQQMPAATVIDSVYYEDNERIRFDPTGTLSETWLSIYLDGHAEEAGTSYFLWEFEETWEFEMPTYVTVYFPHVGFFKKQIDIMPDQFHCWITENSKSILIKSTVGDQKDEIRRFMLTSIAPDDDRLGIRYSILVKQFALNRELYEFFKQLKTVNESNGSIYDIVPSQVYGNIQSIDRKKKALGYFMVSRESTKRIFINSYDAPARTGNSAYSHCGWNPPPQVGPFYVYGTTDTGKVTIGSASKYCVDCRVRGTNEKPDFW